jgi:hypothetical protein
LKFGFNRTTSSKTALLILAILPVGFETAITAHETYSSKIYATCSPEKHLPNNINSVGISTGNVRG